MTSDLLLALTGFALVASITPGPNNLMLMASGANFGLRRTLPHMLGISAGFVVMVTLVGLGVMRLFDAWPAAQSLLTAAGALYLGWLAWRIARAAPPEAGGPRGRPFTFLQAAAFQWVNPKAWTMALTAVTLYAPDRGLGAVLAVAAIFGAVNLPSVSLWAVMGVHLGRWLHAPGRLRAFNLTMAALLLASLWPALAG
ncbi:LysE family translocator [Rhodosalinus halophilus]|uniref:LysE family translocator n=1 Tax=Rhodosalinus halophilus TaxID=2259333 RepID=A0A365UB13_9RHOB|nr:LysE family translocator [Rhodosalinus halophilus]RBI86339.1 LysE family translocator [Rhodosalinus halophilus]